MDRFLCAANKSVDFGVSNPCAFSYDIDKTYPVLPTFDKALDDGLVTGFFKVLYLNPFSGSSVTWKAAFEWL